MVQRYNGKVSFSSPPVIEADHAPSSGLSITLNWAGGSVTGDGTYLFTGSAAYNFFITSLDASIGSAGGSLAATVRNAGLTAGGLSAVAVSNAGKTHYPASGANLAVTAGAIVDVLISVSGTPTDTFLTLNGVR